jgi:hypothetical protein
VSGPFGFSGARFLVPVFWCPFSMPAFRCLLSDACFPMPGFYVLGRLPL